MIINGLKRLHSVLAIYPGPACLYCSPMNPKLLLVVSSPASLSHGDSAKATMIQAVTISYGRGIWWKQQEVFLLPELIRKPTGFSLICRKLSNRMDTGRRICGWMALLIGTEFKWTRLHCLFSW